MSNNVRYFHKKCPICPIPDNFKFCGTSVQVFWCKRYKKWCFRDSRAESIFLANIVEWTQTKNGVLIQDGGQNYKTLPKNQFLTDFDELFLKCSLIHDCLLKNIKSREKRKMALIINLVVRTSLFYQSSSKTTTKKEKNKLWFFNCKQLLSVNYHVFQ